MTQFVVRILVEAVRSIAQPNPTNAAYFCQNALSRANAGPKELA